MTARVDRVSLLLSAQRALLGHVGDSLYGVCVDVRGDWIVVTFYVAPEISEDEREDLSAAGSEIIADFSEGVMIDEQFVEVADSSQKLPTVGEWVFLRRRILVAAPSAQPEPR